MNKNLLTFLSLYSLSLFGHGFHETPRATVVGEVGAVSSTEIGSAIAVRRDYPLKYADCEKVYDAAESFCFVEMAKPSPMHMDYAFPIAPVNPAPEHEVSFDANELGYRVNYFGPAKSKADQLAKVKAAFAALVKQGVTKISIQSYRPNKRQDRSEPFAETVLGPVVGVKRKIAIRASDCAKTLDAKLCRVSVVKESVPDHPGPSGGGEAIVKEYVFSANESVRIELENLYNDYVIAYEGPEVEKSKILGKISQAILGLKGTEKELYLECPMFTLKKARDVEAEDPLFTDTFVSDSVFFEVAMPLDIKLCEATLDPTFQSCEGRFPGQIQHVPWDHTGGNEYKEVDVAKDGHLSIFGTYVTGDPFWRLNYTLNSGVTLTPLELVKKGFDQLQKLGQDVIRAFGFKTSKSDE